MYLNYGEWDEDLIDRHSIKVIHTPQAVVKLKPEQDLDPWPMQYWCSVLPTELSSHLELVNLWVRNIPIEGEECEE